MSGQAVIGALRVVLDADNDNFDRAMDQSQGKLAIVGQAVDDLTARLRDAGAKMAAVGAGITAAISVPFGALATSSVRVAGTFEGAMKRVESALDSVSGDQLKALEMQARTMGPSVGRGASEAAGAIENLAKNGLDASQILGGGFAAAMKLAAAGQADLAPAADLTTDVMQQFGKTAADLGPVVDKVSGALLASKFGFQDYQLAVGQAGGVAGAVGISFEDFNTAIAGTSALFQSGSDAGTSFKTFLTSLSGNSKQARTEMTDLGLSFYDAAHRLKPLADIAESLRQKLGGLSEQARTKVLTDIFGTDGMRTAIGLMQLGERGFVNLQETIAKASADKQVAKNQEGYAAAIQRLSAAMQELKIAIGQSGLLDLFTGITNAMTRVVNGFASMSAGLMRVGISFGAIGSVLGPVLALLGGALWLAVGFFLRKLGPLGWAISAVVEPIGTLVAGLRVLAVSFGMRAILGGLAEGFLGLAGPIGLVVGAIVIFKDYVVGALGVVWDMATRTLGPPLAALFAKLGALFTGLSSGPLATFVSTILDVVGTAAAAFTEGFGAVVIVALDVVVAALTAFATVVSGVVRVVADLLSGDFGQAWTDAEGTVGGAAQAMVDTIKGLFPQSAAWIQMVYESAKQWLSDGFGGIMHWVADTATWMVDALGNTFPRIVAIAREVYEGIKTWLVDNLGPIATWLGAFFDHAAERFRQAKKELGIGLAPPQPVAPPAPAAPRTAKPIAPSSYMPSDDDKEKKKKEKHGPTAEDLRLQKEIEAAQLRGDLDVVQRLQDQLDLNKQVEAYQRTGLSLTEARSRAERDMRDIQAARQVAEQKAITEQQRSVAIDVAKLDRNVLLEDSLSRQAELQKRIDFYKQQHLSQAEAEAAAAKDQAAVDAARARVRDRWFADDADARALRLAQVRGDGDEQIRQLQRVIDVKKRARDLEDQHVAPTDALAQANREADQEHAAELQGKFRDIFRGGFKAALDGNIGDWFKNWWKDRVAKGMEEALNSLSDLIAKLFSQLASGSTSSGGGLLGSIGSALGGLFGKGGKGPSVDMSGWAGPSRIDLGAIDTPSLPAFATGGSFTVGGASGIDRNLVAFRATKGEMVNITRPGNDNGGLGATTINQTLNVAGGVDLATRTETYRLAQATHDAAVRTMDDRQRRRG